MTTTTPSSSQSFGGRTRRALVSVVLLSAALLVTSAPEAFAQGPASPEAAERVVRSRHTQAMQLLQRAPSESRDRRLTALLSEFLDYGALAEAALGDAWDARSEAEQTEFVEILTQLVERSYKQNLGSTLNYDVEYLSAEALDGGGAIITTEARSQQNRRAPPVTIAYRMARDGQDWKVVDIVTDGQSLVAGYRGQFRRLIERDGWDGLVSRMRERLSQ